MQLNNSPTDVCDLEFNISNLEDTLSDFRGDYHSYFQVCRHNQWNNAQHYIQGHILNGKRRNLLQISWQLENCDPQRLQQFITDSPWDHQSLVNRIQDDIIKLSKRTKDIALIIDESGFPKQGNMSVGVQRQYCGYLGKVDNCQVGVFLTYSTPEWSTIFDKRLYMPQKWIDDQARRKKCKVPKELTFKTKAELALEMVQDCVDRNIYFKFVSMDAHYGEQPWLLLEFENRNIIYMADIPYDTQVFRRKSRFEIPRKKGVRGRKPTKPKLAPGEEASISVKQLIETDGQWREIRIRDSERGELRIEFKALRVWRKQDEMPEKEVWLVARREIEKPEEISYSLSNAPINTPRKQLAKMKCRRYWVERSFQDAKSEAKMDQYEIRGWRSWHSHMIMIILTLLLLLKIRLKLQKKRK